MAEAAPPGGAVLKLAKHAAERVLWSRVRVQCATTLRPPARPAPVPPTDVLRRRADWEASTAECRRLRLPSHHDRTKNWDALGAVSTVLANVGPDAAVLDAGSARYSPVLPWLALYGLSDLFGNNLEFADPVRRGPATYLYGDITATSFPAERFDAITCMSVIEHGVPITPFFTEMARLLKPGGVLVVSTDYDQQPPDTSGLFAYGTPVHIFSPSEIKDLVATAGQCGLTLMGELALDHDERPVYWKRLDLSYTFIRLAFRKETR